MPTGAAVMLRGLTEASSISPSTITSGVNFAFSGSALLIFYYFGVVQKLLDLKVIDPLQTRFGGISGGAVTSMLTCAGQTPLQMKSRFNKVFNICRADTTACIRRFSPLAKQYIYDPVLTPQVYEQCGTNHVNVGITKLDPTTDNFESHSPLVVGNFTSAGDMEESLLASSYLSCFMGPWTYTSFRGQPVIDGGYGVDFHDICPDEGDGKRCIKVSVFVVGSNTTAHPTHNPDYQCFAPEKRDGGEPYSPLNNWPNFQPQEWRLPTSCNYDYQKFQAPTNPDIFPGNFNKIKWTAEQWKQLAMCLASPEDNEYIFNMGMMDAQSWYDLEYCK